MIWGRGVPKEPCGFLNQETLVINKAETEEERCMMGKERPTNRVSSKASTPLGMYEQDSGFYKPEG